MPVLGGRQGNTSRRPYPHEPPRLQERQRVGRMVHHSAHVLRVACQLGADSVDLGDRIFVRDHDGVACALQLGQLCVT